jgi:hypothetical protein
MRNTSTVQLAVTSPYSTMTMSITFTMDIATGSTMGIGMNAKSRRNEGD